MDAIALVNGRGFRVKMVKAGRQGYVLTKFSDPKIARHVIDVGFIAHREVPRLLAAADVLIEPGRSNEFNDYRFPSKLPKYLASGKPVVLPRSNIGLLLKNGEEAMVLEHGDSADIADALQRLAADPDLRSRIGQSGRAFGCAISTGRRTLPPCRAFTSGVSWALAGRTRLPMMNPLGSSMI